MLSASALGCVRGERVVFAGLGFRAGAGDALVLTGANGSGKSSLLRLLAGLARPAAGALTWDGVDIRDDPGRHAARCHFVGHLDALKPALTAGEQLAFWACVRSGGSERRRQRREQAEAALAAFGIAHLADMPVRFLSAGQRRRVALARVLTAPAPLWLLDEPATALDADAVRRLDDVIARHRADGGLVILSMHGGARPPGALSLDLDAFAAPAPAVVGC
ncbi:MAG: heme ABC exporter ATP-binding protein CcmA [Rhodospirillales bacterium]|nr:heme ABC exporter ATP-binding protein CcmA [Rhodospirillales bacterium]